MLIFVILGLAIFSYGCISEEDATSTIKKSSPLQKSASKIIVEQVIGDRTDSAGAINDNIQSLIIRIRPDVSAASIDLSEITITVKDKDIKYDLRFSSTGNGTDAFSASAVRDEDGSFNASSPVLNSGDLAAIQISPDAVPSISLPVRKTFWISLVPDLGKAVNLEIITPNSYGINRFVNLYP